MKTLTSNEMSNLQGGSWACAYRTAILVVEAGVGIGVCVETGGLACGLGVGLAAAAYAEFLEACYPSLMS